MIKLDTDIILSINVHEKVNFLLKQLKNIQEHLLNEYYIILNCNDYMYNELKHIQLPTNVIINDEVINKNRYTGTLTQGIHSNMVYALEHFNFKYFIILSSRNLFYKNLSIDNLNKNNKIYTNTKEIIELNNKQNYNTWHWPSFVNTQIAKYYIEKGLELSNSCHEGLVFHYFVCQNISLFLEKNENIKNDLFNFKHCVEEFALQTISLYEINKDNMYYGYTTINKSVETNYTIPTDLNYFVYKTIRE